MLKIILLALSCSFLVVGVFSLMYQLYKITILDAQAREIPHPKLWGFLALGGNNSSGLFIYFLKRRKFPIIHLSATNKKEIETKKKSCAISLTFITIGVIALVICVSFL